MHARPAHVPEKWIPVFRKGHAPVGKPGARSDAFRSECALARIVRAASLGIALLLAAAACAAPARAEDAPAQFPKGLRIGLVPPPGLTPSQKFPGFADADQKAAIAVAELPPQAYYAMETELFRKDGNQGITLERRELFVFASGVGFLATGHQTFDGVSYRKWVLVAPGPGFTVMVQAQVPDSAESSYPEATIRAALATVTLRPAPIDEQLSMLPFRLGNLAGFRVERVLPEGVVVLTDGAPDDQTPDRAHMMVMVSPGGPEQASDQELFAQRLMLTIPGLADLRLTGSEPMRIDGRPGFEIRAQARDPSTGAKLTLIQWLRFGGGGFMRVVAVATEEGWPQAYPRFRAVRDGVETQ